MDRPLISICFFIDIVYMGKKLCDKLSPQEGINKELSKYDFADKCLFLFIGENQISLRWPAIDVLHCFW